MIFELIEDSIKLALIVACLYFARGAYVRRKQPAREFALSIAILWICFVGVSRLVLGVHGLTY